MKKSRLLLVLSIILIASFVLSACQSATEEPSQDVTEAPVAETEPASEEPAAETPASEAELDVFRVAMLADMTSSNVWNLFGPGASTYNYVVQAQYWPTLYGIGDQRFDLVPFLAADFTTPIEEEGDLFVSTVVLKDNFLWSDGSEITADDIAFTAQVVTDFELAGNWGYYVNSIDHVEVVDSKTAKIYYAVRPGLANHEYGTLQDPIVQKAFWNLKRVATNTWPLWLKPNRSSTAFPVTANLWLAPSSSINGKSAHLLRTQKTTITSSKAP
jgi:ABC-type transport system substrate-binding protein